jgi:hypothetical protein
MFNIDLTTPMQAPHLVEQVLSLVRIRVHRNMLGKIWIKKVSAPLALGLTCLHVSAEV